MRNCRRRGGESTVVYHTPPLVFDDVDYRVGTISAQAIEIAVFMVGVLQYQQWPGIRIVAGDTNMCWGAWVAADYHQIPIYGFEPKPVDIDRKQRSLPGLMEILDLNLDLDSLLL